MGYTQPPRASWSATISARKRLVLAVLLAVVLGLSLSFFHCEPASRNLLSLSGSGNPKHALNGKGDNLVDIHNETLGVSIFVSLCDQILIMVTVV